MKTVIKRLFLLISILTIWQVISIFANPIFIPSPKDVFSEMLELISNGQLLIAMMYSLRRIFVATIISGLVAFPVALLIYNSKIAYDILHPIISTLRYVPVTAFYPLLIMWFGIEESMKVAFLFIATFVYMMPSVILCLDEINQDLIDTGLTLGMSRFQTITKIQIPACLPSVMNSFIMMIGIGFTYIAVCEQINAVKGLGYIIQQSSARGRTDLVFMGIMVIMILSFIIDNFANKLVQKVFKWRYLDDRN